MDRVAMLCVIGPPPLSSLIVQVHIRSEANLDLAVFLSLGTSARLFVLIGCSVVLHGEGGEVNARGPVRESEHVDVEVEQREEGEELRGVVAGGSDVAEHDADDGRDEDQHGECGQEGESERNILVGVNVREGGDEGARQGVRHSSRGGGLGAIAVRGYLFGRLFQRTASFDDEEQQPADVGQHHEQHDDVHDLIRDTCQSLVCNNSRAHHLPNSPVFHSAHCPDHR